MNEVKELAEVEILHEDLGEILDNDLASSSEWQLIWLRFKKNRLAVVSAVVIAAFYIMALFCGFWAPYLPETRNPKLIYAPPQVFRFRDENGFSFRPFVYGYKSELDPNKLERKYTLDKAVKYPIHFFTKGESYKLFGLFRTDIHLFGAANGGRIFLFGTDSLGRDVFSRAVYGSRISVSIGLVGVFLSFVLGLVLGGISGYFGGAVDNLIQRFMEVLLSFPRVPLWMALSAALPSNWSIIKTYFAITVLLALVGWVSLARVTRSKIMSLKNEDFIVAARLSGTKGWRIITRHFIPSFMSHLIASITLSIPQMILGETGLSFLGLGLRPPAISWGVLLQAAQNVYVVTLAPWLMFPAIFVVVFVLSFNFLGDGLRNAADPYA